MFKISRPLAFLLALPSLIPILICCIDFFGSKVEIKSVVTDKLDFGGSHPYRIYFKRGFSTALSNEDLVVYDNLNIGDTINLTVGSLLKPIYEIKSSHMQKTIKPDDFIPLFLMSIISLFAFLGCVCPALNKWLQTTLLRIKDPKMVIIPFLLIGYFFFFTYLSLIYKNR